MAGLGRKRGKITRRDSLLGVVIDLECMQIGQRGEKVIEGGCVIWNKRKIRQRKRKLKDILDVEKMGSKTTRRASK